MDNDRNDVHIMRLRGRRLALRYLLLLGAALLFLAPLYWMIASSLKPEYDVFARPPIWWPNPPRWRNYVEALTKLPFQRYAVNTLIIAVFSVVGYMLSCTVVAYGFARLRAPGKDTLFVLMLATLMLPYPVVMIPQYVIFSELDLVNTFWPLILPAFLGSPFYIFLLRQFFMQIPPDLEDAARIDGANLGQILWYIMLPLARPAMATVAIFSFQFAWNDFLAPLIYLQDQSKYTLMLGLSFFRSSFQVNWAYLMAASLTVALPVIILFFLAQREFVEGITLGGIKQ
ncbi:MAG TPA: carbohydrate ABC transporter permease [Anaerolineae bacterium]|nr:carbohydrate ABC transporter permease [Anaerolineae bacterium]